MENKVYYEIGDVISWKVGNVFAKGIVKEDLGTEVLVMCFEVNNRPSRTEIKVNKECIINE